MINQFRSAALASFEATCGDITAAIGMALRVGLAPVRGKPMKEVQREFFIELAKEAYVAGYGRGRQDADG